MNDTREVDRIYKKYIINEFSENTDLITKLLPTENNKKFINFLLNETEDFYNGYSKIIENFNYFCKK